MGADRTVESIEAEDWKLGFPDATWVPMCIQKRQPRGQCKDVLKSSWAAHLEHRVNSTLAKPDPSSIY